MVWISHPTKEMVREISSVIERPIKVNGLISLFTWKTVLKERFKIFQMTVILLVQ